MKSIIAAAALAALTTGSAQAGMCPYNGRTATRYVPWVGPADSTGTRPLRVMDGIVRNPPECTWRYENYPPGFRMISFDNRHGGIGHSLIGRVRGPFSFAIHLDDCHSSNGWVEPAQTWNFYAIPYNPRPGEVRQDDC
jgi:hypothetical protein